MSLAMPPVIKFALAPCAYTPKRQTEGSSGFDLKALYPGTAKPGQVALIDTGVAFEIPPGWEGQIRPRSGLASKGAVVILGTIDSDYRGPVKVQLYNLNRNIDIVWNAGDRIAQIVFVPVFTGSLKQVEMERLSETERGANGFGHTGV